MTTNPGDDALVEAVHTELKASSPWAYTGDVLHFAARFVVERLRAGGMSDFRIEKYLLHRKPKEPQQYDAMITCRCPKCHREHKTWYRTMQCYCGAEYWDTEALKVEEK